MDLPPAIPPEPGAPASGARAFGPLPWLLVLVAAAPPLVLRYLPMADLPQHVAVASILAHLRDPAYGFGDYYAFAPGQTLYYLPYALAVALSLLLPIQWAMHAVVSLSIVAYLGGMLRLLRALGKPWPLLLLAVPFAYNRAFFWGFVSFNLAVGLAILAIALLIEPSQGGRRQALVALVLLASVLTHVYGVVLFLAYAGLWLLSPERRTLRARLPVLALAVVATAFWLLLGARAQGYGPYVSPGALLRLELLPQQLLGGYQDLSEEAVLAGVLLAFGVLSAGRLPLTRARLRALGPHEQLLWALVLLNVLLYFILPLQTHTAKLIYFRHIVIAGCLLPALSGWSARGLKPALGMGLLAAVGLGALLNTWLHLAAFSREAEGFERIVDALPRNSRTLYMAIERNGAVMRTDPYVHFGAYAQAERGGLVSPSFPHLFWNLPLRLPDGSQVPALPENFEWSRGRFDDARFGHYYPHVLIRSPWALSPPPPTPGFPYRLVRSEAPWQLFERVAPGPAQAH